MLTDEEKMNATMELKNKILKVMDIYNRPVTANEIAEELDVPLKLIKNIFTLLLSRGEIIEYSSKSGKRYYEPASKKEDINETISQKYVDMASALEKQYEEIKEENEELRNQIDKLYSNMISLMGIFVAIFALVIINVDAINSFVSKVENAGELFLDLVVLNIPIIISIGTIIVLIKIFILPKKKG